MGDFEEKLERILNDPQTMSQIMSFAQTLGTSSSQSEPQPVVSFLSMQDSGPSLDPRLLNGIFALINQYNQTDDQKVALLLAIKPFLREERHAGLEKAIQITKLSRMAHIALELFRAEEDDHV